MRNKPLAAIDIGTNTCRLLIAEIYPDKENDSYSIREIYSERVITRLGKGIREKGIINKDAVARNIGVLKRFRDITVRNRVFKTSAVATSALREARNRDEFLNEAKKTAGLDIKIITGEEEAEKTLSGILAGISLPDTSFIVDIGGGSTELIFAGGKTPLQIQSLKLGVVFLAEHYMKNDPPAREELLRMESKISGVLASAVELFKNLLCRSTAFIGTAGTVTALAAISQNLTRYDHNKIHNSVLTGEKVRDMYFLLSSITAQEREKYHPFEPERLDIIVPGTCILLKIMETFGFKDIIVSNYGLREGILIDLYRLSTGRENG